ncbi:MAG: alkaline phosphatase family protein [Abditibacteriales bacterium]|nr:alkaline phosphatase family protein [Abditibacteriales bacterium]MDW8365279.1 alkaline phosphatase family protein [Abditibacteriales bacterium]
MKVLVLGLDCAPPDWVFEKWIDDLPNIKRLRDNGIWAPIRSCDPPITVPAWAVFATSKDPGKLGIFGFRNRKGYSYTEQRTVSSALVTEPAVWDYASRAGKRCIIIGVPPNYPPKPVNGLSIGCFLTPDTDSDYTYPKELKREIKAVVGDYKVDVEEFRTDDKDPLLAEIYDMTEKRWTLAKHLLQTKPWDFFFLMEIGTDRIHHAFWKYLDPQHRQYVAGNPYERVILDYYVYLDRRIGEVLSLIGEDTAVVVVSDHGCKRMDGCINVNDWLIQNGYFKLREKPRGLVRPRDAQVDWARTIAWGAGGYYARVWLNVKGREEQGVVDPRDYDRVCDELAAGFQRIPDEVGNPLDTKVLKTRELYPDGNLVGAPDLIVYFGDLRWRCTEDIGHEGVHSFEAEVGPDDAVHDYYGLFILSHPHLQRTGRIERPISLLDGAPTLLRLLGLDVPRDMQGQVIE